MNNGKKNRDQKLYKKAKKVLKIIEVTGAAFSAVVGVSIFEILCIMIKTGMIYTEKVDMYKNTPHTQHIILYIGESGGNDVMPGIKIYENYTFECDIDIGLIDNWKIEVIYKR